MQKHETDITLQQMYALWERKATALDYSPVTIRNTRSHLSMIDHFIPLPRMKRKSKAKNEG